MRLLVSTTLGVTLLTEEKPGIDISDSVIMGDVQQNILKIDECPNCSATNVKVLKCQDKRCTTIKFCELCHLNCRYEMGNVLRFDSGRGAGPFCSECLSVKIFAHGERLERERLERIEMEELKQIEKERLEQIENERFGDLSTKEREYFEEILDIFIRSLTANIEEIDANPEAYMRTAMDKVIRAYSMKIGKESKSKIFHYLKRELLNRKK